MPLKGEPVFLPEKHKHCVIYDNVKSLEAARTMLYYEDIAAAKTEANTLLLNEPNAAAHVFQLRSAMCSKIQVEASDFNM